MSTASAVYLVLAILLFVGFGLSLFSVQLYVNAMGPRARTRKVRRRSALAKAIPSSGAVARTA